MCLKPIRIRNPKISWTMTDAKYLTVPCGHCMECRQKKQLDWFIRGYFEYQSTVKNGGSVFACCLTYADQYLPVYTDKRNFQYVTAEKTVDKPVDYSFKGFDQHSVLNFMKLWRIRFQRKYNRDSKGIKFFIASEYGSRTHRPHYHCLVYVPYSNFNDLDFFNLTDYCWKYGFVSKDKRQSWKVQTQQAIQYASKYVTKDLFFYDKEIRDYLDKEHLSAAEYEYRLSKCKNFLPKFHCSQHYGQYLVDLIENSTNPLEILQRDKVTLPLKNGKTKEYSIPTYVKNKLIKAPQAEISALLDRLYYRHTEIGSQALKTRLNDRITKDTIKLKDYTNQFYLKSLLPESLIQMSKTSFFSLITSLSSKLSAVNLEDLVRYKDFLRYLPVGEYRNKSKAFIIGQFDTLVKDFFEESIPWELYSIIRNTDQTPEDFGYSTDKIGLSLKDMEEAKSIDTFSDTLTFRDYEEICILLDDFETLLSQSRFELKRCKEEKIDETKSHFTQIEEYGSINQDK